MTTLATLYRAGLMSPGDKAILAQIPYPLSGMIYQSDTPPASPTATPFWFNTTDGQMYVYYSSAWVTVSNFSGGNGYVPSTGGTMINGTIDNTVIGGTTPAAATVTSMNGGQLAGFRNRFINGSFDINQRSWNSVTTTGALTYTLDRWTVGTAGAGIGVSQSTPPTGLAGTKNCILLNGQASNTAVSIRQRIESSNIYDLIGKSITISMQIYSSVAYAANGLNFYLSYPSAVDNWTNQTTQSSLTFPQVVPVNTWTTVSYTIPLLQSVFSAGFEFCLIPGAMVSGVTMYIANAQIEPGISVTPLERRSINLEADLCRRYFQRLQDPIWTSYVAGAGTTYKGEMFYIMRTAPTMTTNTVGNLSNCTVAGMGAQSANNYYIQLSASAAGTVQINAYVFDLTAEL